MTRAKLRLTPPQVLTNATNAARKCCLLFPQIAQYIRQANEFSRRQPPLPLAASQVFCDLGTNRCAELCQWLIQLHDAIAEVESFLTPDVPNLVRIRRCQYVSWHHAVKEIGIRLVTAIKWFAGDVSPDLLSIDKNLVLCNWRTLSEGLSDAERDGLDDSLALAEGVATDAYGLVVQESYAAARRMHQTQLSPATPSPERANGPAEIGAFNWEGVRYRNLTPRAFKLVSLLWDSRDRTTSIDEAADEIYGEDSAPEDGFGSHRTAANSFFRVHGIPLRVMIKKKVGRICLVDAVIMGRKKAE